MFYALPGLVGSEAHDAAPGSTRQFDYRDKLLKVKHNSTSFSLSGWFIATVLM
jgi:hypothetical protein